MLKNLSDLHFIFKSSDIKNYNILIFIIIINSFFELLSFGALVPMVGAMIDGAIYENIYNFFNKNNIFFISDNNLVNKENFIIFSIFAILFLYIIKYSINLFFNHYLANQKISYEKKIADKILKNILLNFELNVLNIPKSRLLHDITNRLSTVSTTIINISNLAAEALIMFILILFLSLSFGNKTFYLLSILVFISIIFFNFYKKKAIDWSMERGEGGNQRSKNLLDLLEGMREVIIFGNFKYLFNEFKQNNNKFLDPLKKILFWNSVPKIALEFLFILFFLSYFLYSIFLGVDFGEIFVTIALVGIILLRALPSLNRILFNYSQIKYATEPIKSIKNFLHTSSTKKKQHNQNVNFNDEIILSNISFEYEKNQRLINNLDFNIKKNSKIGICGSTGSGKSTLIDLIAGLKIPNKGKITIDNFILNKDLVENWIENIAYVSQKVYLFNTSIRNNITLKDDKEKIDEDRFNRAIQIVELNELVESKHEKEFSSVGEFGNILSGGQKQKVGLARALYSDRSIIILDESTNSLDEKTETAIINKIVSLDNKTILLITHNLKNLEVFEQIYKLENKKLKKIK